MKTYSLFDIKREQSHFVGQVSLITPGAAIGNAVIRYNLLQCLLEGYLFLRVASRLPGTHPLKIPFSPNWGYFLWLIFLYLVFLFAYLDFSRFLFSISFLFRLAAFYMTVPLILGRTIISS